MTYHEFCNQIAPSVLDLENECRKMREEEFKEFRSNVMCEVGKQELNMRFMTAVFDVIYNELFAKKVDKGQEGA